MNRLSDKRPWIAFLVLLVLPLYALTAIVVVRSDILSFSGTFTDEQFKAMWTFIASGLATCATVLAAILTKSHNDRSLALQAEADKRKELLDKETSWRLNLETTLGGLKVMAPEGKASPAVVAGGLATIVNLGQPLIALRVLATALDYQEVDRDTAAWVLNVGLLDSERAVREEAAGLLYEHGAEFTDEAKPGFYSWPDCVNSRWILGLPGPAGGNVVFGLLELLVARDQIWWEESWTWVLYTLDQAMRGDPDPTTQWVAATACDALVPCWGDEYIYGTIGPLLTSEVRDRARAIVEEQGGPNQGVERDPLVKWGEDRTWSKPRSAVTAIAATVPAEREPMDEGHPEPG